MLRHRGSMSEVARKLGVTRQHVSDWLRGRTVSARIEAAVISIVNEILEGEKNA